MQTSILIAEDDALLLRALEKQLHEKGYKVFTARNGSEAINIICDENIDLIISDIMMPEISGLSFLAAIQAQPKGKVPVIVMSTLTGGKQLAEDHANKYVSFLPKPFLLEHLFDRINSLLNQTRP